MSSGNADIPDFKYAGWVPTVNGRLSFRHIGESRHPKPSVYANIALRAITPQHRVILAFQKRPLGDTLFYLVTDFVAGVSGSFWFVLAANSPREATESNEIAGTIYIFKSRDDWKEKAKNQVRTSVRMLHSLQSSLSPEREREMLGVYEGAKDTLHRTADITTEFRLTRNGEAYFSAPVFLDPDLEYASVGYANSMAQDLGKWVADQSYFFLRDICHLHQHHDRAEDTILILQERDDGDLEWRKRVIYSLYFYIIRAKRTARAPFLIRALGVQAYCQSFKRICAPLFRAAPDFKVPHFNDLALTQSLRARIEEESLIRQIDDTNAIRRATTGANWRMYVLTVALIVATIIAALAPELVKNPLLSGFANLLAPVILPIFECFIVGVTFCFIVTSERMLRWRDTLEISNVHRRAANIITLVVGLAVAGFVLWMGRIPIGIVLAALWNAI